MDENFRQGSYAYLKKPPLTLQAMFLATHKTGIALLACNMTNYGECTLPKKKKKGSKFGMDVFAVSTKTKKIEAGSEYFSLRSIIWSKCRNNMHPRLIFFIPYFQAIINHQCHLGMTCPILKDIEQRLP